MSHLNPNPVIYSVEEVKKLVEEAKQGNESSFAQLYHAFFTPVYRYVFSRVKDKDKSDDVVQMVFIRWHGALASYEVKASPLQYLFVIARRILIDESKKKETYSLDEETFDSLRDETPLADEILDVHLTTEVVLEEFKHLSELHQEVLRLHFFAEQSTAEIAQILGKLEPAIRQVKHRALRTLKDRLSNLNENT